MKNQNLYSVLYMLGILITIALAGCISLSKSLPMMDPVPLPTVIFSTQITNTVTSPPVQTNTSEQKLAIQPTPTPIPTQNPDQSVAMNDLLHSKDCELPCYLGIIPGKTNLAEAKVILAKIGARYNGSFTSDPSHVKKYTYHMRIGSPDYINQSPGKNGVLNTIFHEITLFSSNEVVEGIDTYVSTTDKSTTELKESFRKYWSQYSAREILKHYGVPDQISLDTVDPQMANLGRKLMLAYQKQGIVVEIYGNEEENNICSEPGYETRFLDLHMVIIDRTSGIDPYTEGGIPPMDKLHWTPLEEALGITKEEFYNRIAANPYACFMSKKE